ADGSIAQYNWGMHHLVNEKGERLFPKGLRLIAHWNLRDELRADYADSRGPEKQRQIVRVMERIVTQTIPASVIDNPHFDWNPSTNAVAVAPAGEIEADAPGERPSGTPVPRPEPDTRSATLLGPFRALAAADLYSPTTPTS